MSRKLYILVAFLVTVLIIASCTKSADYTSNDISARIDVTSADINSEVEFASQDTIESTSLMITSESSESVESIIPDFDNDIMPIIEVNDEGIRVRNTGFDELNQRLEEICSSIKERYPNNTIKFMLYRTDAKIVSIRVVVLKSNVSIFAFSSDVLYQESYNFDSKGNDISIAYVLNSEGIQFVQEEKGMDILSDGISWGVNLSSFCIFLAEGVITIPINGEPQLFSEWLTNGDGECYGLSGKNEIVLNDLALNTVYDNVSIYRVNNLSFLINDESFSIVPEEYGFSSYWSGYIYLYYDGESSIYLSLEYHGDLDNDDFHAIYSLHENGPRLEYIEELEYVDIPNFDLMDILDNV